MEDSAAVAGLLWDQWLPVGVRRLAAEALPQGEPVLTSVHQMGWLLDEERQKCLGFRVCEKPADRRLLPEDTTHHNCPTPATATNSPYTTYDPSPSTSTRRALAGRKLAGWPFEAPCSPLRKAG
jgi:hypothetical protein